MEISNLSESKIREGLLSFGVTVGPITPTTRKVYIRKLEKLVEERGKLNKKIVLPNKLSFDSSSTKSSSVKVNFKRNLQRKKFARLFRGWDNRTPGTHSRANSCQGISSLNDFSRHLRGQASQCHSYSEFSARSRMENPSRSVPLVKSDSPLCSPLSSTCLPCCIPDSCETPTLMNESSIKEVAKKVQAARAAVASGFRVKVGAVLVLVLVCAVSQLYFGTRGEVEEVQDPEGLVDQQVVEKMLRELKTLVEANGQASLADVLRLVSKEDAWGFDKYLKMLRTRCEDPAWGLEWTGDGLRARRADRSVMVVSILLVVTCLIGGVSAWREHRRRQVYTLVARIIKETRACAPDLCLASQLRDSVVPPEERGRKRHLWLEAVRLVARESRLKKELVRMDGEDHMAWRWVAPRHF